MAAADHLPTSHLMMMTNPNPSRKRGRDQMVEEVHFYFIKNKKVNKCLNILLLEQKKSTEEKHRRRSPGSF